MTATGIVRRIDDLGRVVIPRDIRRNMRIKEGDTLEIFTTKNGEVVLKKYSYANEHDWAKAKAIVKALTDLPFALYNNYGDIQRYTKMGMPNHYDSRENAIHNHDNDIIGFIYFDANILKEDANKIFKVLKEFFSEI